VDVVRAELGSLERARAGARARTRAAPAHVVVLALAVALAFVHRALQPIPGFDALARAWPLAVLAGLALLFLAPLLVRALAWVGRPAPRRLARELDDRHHWQDETDTALDLPPAGEATVAVLLRARTLSRLRDVRVSRPGVLAWRWPRRLLAFLFVFVLLAPGVDGLLGERGAGRRGGGVVGSAGTDAPAPATGPGRADLWLRDFVETPVRVEPLPEAVKHEPETR
jgi:hypothetical protein